MQTKAGECATQNIRRPRGKGRGIHLRRARMCPHCDCRARKEGKLTSRERRKESVSPASLSGTKESCSTLDEERQTLFPFAR